MFSPDDLTPALIALPYVTYSAKRVVKSSALRGQILATRPGFCRWFPYFCNS